MATTPITGPLDCWEAQETTILASKLYDLVRKKKKEYNPVQNEGLWPMVMHKVVNTKKGDKQISQLQALSLLTYSAIPGTHTNYW